MWDRPHSSSAVSKNSQLWIPACFIFTSSILSLISSILLFSSSPFFTLRRKYLIPLFLSPLLPAFLAGPAFFMDPCPFLRILVGNLALKFPVAAKPSFSGVHPSTSPCFCKIKLNDFPTQFVTIPLLVDGEISGAASSSSSSSVSSQSHSSLAACFSLNKSQIEKLVKRKDASVKIEVYTGRLGPATCSGDVFGSSAKLLGRITVPVTGSGLSETKPCVFQNGWTGIGEGKKGYSSAQLHLTVRSEPDPRFVFRFDGEPECSPQVFQVQGSVQQPVFTCKFGFRNERDWDRSRYVHKSFLIFFCLFHEKMQENCEENRPTEDKTKSIR